MVMVTGTIEDIIAAGVIGIMETITVTEQMVMCISNRHLNINLLRNSKETGRTPGRKFWATKKLS